MSSAPRPRFKVEMAMLNKAGNGRRRCRGSSARVSPSSRRRRRPPSAMRFHCAADGAQRVVGSDEERARRNGERSADAALAEL